MKNIINQPDIYVEIGTGALLVIRENDNAEWPVERSPDGRLTAACKEKLIAALKHFLQPKNWQSRRAICAISARGVSLRQLSLPTGAKEEFHNRLLLQIESEFPLSPDELAWGYQSLGQSVSGSLVKQTLLVAAVKKEVVADYQEILAAAGTTPVFTLASFARNRLCPHANETHVLLDIGEQQSELTRFENGVPVNSRMIFWAMGANLDSLAQAIKSSSDGAKIYISGQKISDDFATQLNRALGVSGNCERLAVGTDKRFSAAILGLKKLTELNAEPPLVLSLNQKQASANATTPDTKKWLVRAVCLIAALLLLPYAEAILLKGHLAKKVAQYQADAVRLQTVDRELDFLRYLKQTQPPYVNALFLFSKSVSPGAKFDSITMNGHGDVALRASFGGGQQVTDFRAKLVDSGAFTNVVVEEQAPAPNGQMVNVRMTAHWKAGVQWPVAKPPTEDANTNTNSAKSVSSAKPMAGKETN